MEQVSNLPVLASAHGIELFGYQGSQWVSGEVVGQKLGYAHPRKYINNLYNRHKNEFKEDENIVLNLRTMFLSKRGKKSFFERKTRLFSVPNGVFRLCMISDAPNRVDVHNEILQIFDVFRYGHMFKSMATNQPVVVSESYIKEIKKSFGPTNGNKVVKALFKGEFDYKDYFMPIEEMAKMPDGSSMAAAVKKEVERTGKCKQTIYALVNKYRKAFGINKPPTKLTGEPRRPRSNKGVTKYVVERDKVIEFIKGHPEYLGKRSKKFQKKDIGRILNISHVPEGTINVWIRSYVVH